MHQKSFPTRRFTPPKGIPCLLALLTFTLFPASTQALIQPDSSAGPLAERTFRHPDLSVSDSYVAPARMGQTAAAEALTSLERLGVDTSQAFVDQRTGRWGALLLSEPLLPGSGRNNLLSWETLGQAAPRAEADLRQNAWNALSDYLNRHQGALKIDTEQLAQPARIALNDHLVQVHAPRAYKGIPVRESYMTAIINRGNLVLLGTRNWGDIDLSVKPRLNREQAITEAQNFLASTGIEGHWKKPHLSIVPVANGSFLSEPPLGQGLAHRLAWVISPRVAGEYASYEFLIDAHSGEVLAFQDTNHYASTRSVTGGVYPASNDGAAPDGIEQPNWPMPFADVLDEGGNVSYTDSSGGFNSCVEGRIGTQLDGLYVNISDDCGNLAEVSNDVLNLGTSGGDDCVVPSGTSAGNTHSARSGFYELNRIKEMARGQLPDNFWLTQQLTANMNINSSCNAFWNGSTVNFYRSGAGCGNTGELAGVFDHEWGHGMDNFDVNPSISNPGEGIADVYAALRLNDSCMGRGFLPSNCSGYGDACLDCSGVRDIDFAKRASGEPHDIAWIDANCGSGDSAPCGGSVHCEGAVYAEAIWDLFNRDLQAAPVSMDLNTALELTTRLTYQGAGPVGQWYNCSDGTGTGNGCNADGGYLNFLAADDDNGDITDGTPHMSAIFDAFSRHGIACNVPVVQDSGCSGAPTIAPVVTTLTADHAVQLSWSAVPGAQTYEVFRTDGVFGCDFGKTKIASTTDLQFLDSELLNGREYSYTVAAVGSSPSCLGPMSACTAVTAVAGANLAVTSDSLAVEILTGDDDLFLDNCEEARLDFEVVSTGNAAQTNVRITSVEFPSHPETLVTTELPITLAADFASCDIADAGIEILASGLEFDEDIEVLVTVTSDELFPLTVTQSLTIGGTESDFASLDSETFDYESDLQNWRVETGTFGQQTIGGGANGSDTFVASSSNLDSQCDQIVSPLIRLNADSTLSLYNKYDIEGFFPGGGVWYDRANVGIVVADGSRNTVAPDGGRGYDASGANGTCGTEGEGGYAGTQATWAESTFSATALDSAALAGEPVRLAIHYGTDPAASGAGFSFDDLELTNFELQVADTQSNVCEGGDPSIFSDSFESGDTSRWTKAAGNTSVSAGGLPGAGSFKLDVAVDATATKSYVQSSQPSAEATFEASFLLDVNSVDLGNKSVEILRFYNSSPVKMGWLKLRQVAAGQYKVRFFQVEDDGALSEVAKMSVGASGTTAIRVQWVAASSPGANDGIVRLFRNDNLKAESLDLDTDLHSVDVVRLGLPKGSEKIAGSGGTLHFDDYDSRP